MLGQELIDCSERSCFSLIFLHIYYVKLLVFFHSRREFPTIAEILLMH